MVEIVCDWLRRDIVHLIFQFLVNDADGWLIICQRSSILYNLKEFVSCKRIASLRMSERRFSSDTGALNEYHLGGCSQIISS